MSDSRFAARVRPDLAAAQAAALQHIASAGASWNGLERTAMAAVAFAAFDDEDSLPPWVGPSAAGRTPPSGDVLADVVVDAIYRIARHASTLTDDWYRSQVEQGISPVAFVEMVGVVVSAAALDGFFRAAGMDRPELLGPRLGPASGRHPVVESAELNWVPVAVPADRDAAVVQGLSAVPAEWENVARLLAAQYIPVEEMDELGWNRGTLTRAEMEVVATRLSAARECFY